MMDQQVSRQTGFTRESLKKKFRLSEYLSEGIISITAFLTVAIILLIFYVGAVIATRLFGAAFPDWFGTLGASAYTLFQVMTLESWSMGISRPVMEQFMHSRPEVIDLTRNVPGMYHIQILGDTWSTSAKIVLR